MEVLHHLKESATILGPWNCVWIPHAPAWYYKRVWGKEVLLKHQKSLQLKTWSFIWLHVKFKDWTFGVSYTERWTKWQGQQQAKYCWRERGAFQWSRERSADVKTCCPSGVAGLQVILHCVWRWRPLEKNAVLCEQNTGTLAQKTAACGCLFRWKPPIEVPQWILPERTALDTTLKIWPKRASMSMTCP